MTVSGVSVVIPTYNYARYVGEAIESVLTQDLTAREVIVVDDGSVDDTSTVVRSFRSHVTYIHQTNQGQGRARNRGIQASTGDLVAFLDADDRWLPGKLRSQVEVMSSRPDVGICHTAIVVSVDGTDRRRIVRHWPLSGHHPTLEEVLFECNVFVPTAVVRRQILEEVGMFDSRVETCEDWNLWLRLGLRGYRFYYLNEPTTVVRQHGANYHVGIGIEEHLRRNEAMFHGLLATEDDRIPAGFEKVLPSVLHYQAARIAFERRDLGRCALLLARSLSRRPQIAVSLLARAVRRWLGGRAQCGTENPGRPLFDSTTTDFERIR